MVVMVEMRKGRKSRGIRGHRPAIVTLSQVTHYCVIERSCEESDRAIAETEVRPVAVMKAAEGLGIGPVDFRVRLVDPPHYIADASAFKGWQANGDQSGHTHPDGSKLGRTTTCWDLDWVECAFAD